MCHQARGGHCGTTSHLEVTSLMNAHNAIVPDSQEMHLLRSFHHCCALTHHQQLLKDVSMATHAYSWKLVTPTLILEYSVTESNRREEDLHEIVISEQRQTDLPFRMKHFVRRTHQNQNWKGSSPWEECLCPFYSWASQQGICRKTLILLFINSTRDSLNYYGTPLCIYIKKHISGENGSCELSGRQENGYS